MMLQDILVYIILGVVAVIVGITVVKRFRSRKSSPCDGCSGCDLKHSVKDGGGKSTCGCG